MQPQLKELRGADGCVYMSRWQVPVIVGVGVGVKYGLQPIQLSLGCQAAGGVCLQIARTRQLGRDPLMGATRNGGWWMVLAG